MLRFPGSLTAEGFLAGYWHKGPLFMPRALDRIQPALTRNELAWLATLDDVESRIIFAEHSAGRTRYRMENGPFDAAFMRTLPRRDWSLLVHDVEKHVPAMRRLLERVPFVPDWRIDDLMVSFAVPGGGVGPHRDRYDVFLCQGIGKRDWRFSTAAIREDKAASDDLALLQEFQDGERHAAAEGDVLYLPPGVAHWGVATSACLTYSIGMRAPEFYADPDLRLGEVRPGYISAEAQRRAGKDAGTLGRVVTELKDWLRPTPPDRREIAALLGAPATLHTLRLHGMTRIAYDDARLYANGAAWDLAEDSLQPVAALCARRRLSRDLVARLDTEMLRWLLAQGAFELPDTA